jgi:aminodeoxyfutalosine deaminase
MISSKRRGEECPDANPVDATTRELMNDRLVKARWIFPVISEPIADAAIEVVGKRIVALHRRAPRAAKDLGDVAIVPGFVNAHTHLEFSDLTVPLQPASPFADWMRTLIAYRRQRGEGAEAVRRGIEECRRSGTAAVGEIVTQDWAADAPADVAEAVLFRELIGFRSETVEKQFETAQRFLEGSRGVRAGAAVRGLSPHAPYSVHPALFERLVALAAARRAPVAIHLAETKAELQLLGTGTGPLVELLSDLGAWEAGNVPRGTRPLDYLRLMTGLERVIVAHGNYLDAAEIDFVAGRRNFAIAFCPRTHAFFGHAEHPWRTLAARGALVAIGTDGRCSNPDLSVWNELLFLSARFPGCDPALLLRLGTVNGARALGRESDLGTLELGKSAQVAVIQLGQASGNDPYDDLFHPNSRVARLGLD